MSKRMLIDGTHPEETRVVVLQGNRLEDFDVETSTKKQLKGNIYLAKVTRVEPSLQAAFVDYGGNRHGFLAFSEIHPDYYQIPVADREALLAQEAEYQAKAAAEAAEADEHDDEPEAPAVETEQPEAAGAAGEDDGGDSDSDVPAESAAEDAGEAAAEAEEHSDGEADDAAETSSEASERQAVAAAVETVGGDEAEEVEPRRPARPHRHYKIQEVIKRRQILLVQVVKEERGNKGAALTTYLSLAGRYCVLMPNTARGGGVSRKITNAADRRRLRKHLSELEIPQGMGVIMRTAGMERNKAEIKRDLEFLQRTWDNVREFTLQSTAPALVYEEGDLIKRAIRDLYTRDTDEILVDGQEAYQTAKTFMRLLMPSHAKKVQQYRDETIPLFHRYQVEGQIGSMHSPVVQLKSGGYIVINPTEALVSIDVNSGRATRERNIEETAYKTNLEASDEIARQLRLRDLAGLVVIDYIDMDVSRNQRNVERRLKEAMKIDRARIQVGRISAFGLLELSRQRLRPSLLEASTDVCPHCGGAGHIRSIESTSVHVLRAIEEEGIRKRSAEVSVVVPTSVALYLLNQKRSQLIAIEQRYGFHVSIEADDTLIPPDYRLERIKARPEEEESAVITVESGAVEHAAERDEEEDAEEAKADAEAARGAEGDGEGQAGGKRRRRPRRRRKRDEDTDTGAAQSAEAGEDEPVAAEAADDGDAAAADGHEDEVVGDDEKPKRRRRGRRGGRRRHRRDAAESDTQEESRAAGDGDGEDGQGIAAVAETDVPDQEEDQPEPVIAEAPEPEREQEAAPEEPVEEPAAEPLLADAEQDEEPEAAVMEEPAAVPQAVEEDEDEDRPLAPVPAPEPALAGAEEPSPPVMVSGGGAGEPDGEPEAPTDKDEKPRRGWWQRIRR